MGRRWLPRDKAELTRRWNEGQPVATIARAMARPEASIMHQARKLDLPRRHNNGRSNRNRDAGALIAPIDNSAGHDATPAKPVPRERRCLRCNAPFMSSGSGHRICDDCKARPEFQSPDLTTSYVLRRSTV